MYADPARDAAGHQRGRCLVANSPDNLAQVPQGDRVVIPASGDYPRPHADAVAPLVGVSRRSTPAARARLGDTHQANSKPSSAICRGHRAFEGAEDIATPVAEQFKRDWEANSGAMPAKLPCSAAAWVRPLTIPAHDAQLVEQLRWTVEMARCFRVPLHKRHGTADAEQRRRAQSGLLHADFAGVDRMHRSAARGGFATR